MRPKVAQAFVALLLGQFLFGIAFGAMSLYILFNGSESAEACAAAVQGSPWIQNKVCGRTSSVRGITVGGFLILWFLEIGNFILTLMAVIILILFQQPYMFRCD